MTRVSRVFLNLIFCIQILLVFLLFFEERISLPAWLQVAGRMHPLVLHVPIGGLILLVFLILFQRQIGSDAVTKVIHIGLLLTSLSASVAALFGFFLSLQGDYGGDSLLRHKVSGVVLSWLCYGTLLWQQSGKARKGLIGLGTVSLIVLIVTGHTGSIITHGENFLWAPVSPKVVLTAANASLYDFAVRPVLERKCFTCHNESKAKGGLVMTSVEQFVKGGDNGKPWTDGHPEDSRMIKAFYLPLDQDEHMPPDGKPQLTALEISLLKAWISSGPDFEKRLSQYDPSDSLHLIVAALGAIEAEPAIETLYTFAPAAKDVVEDLNTPFCTVFPLYKDSPALQADFFVSNSFQESSLTNLGRVADQLVVLNLSKMPLSDKSITTIREFKRLEHLNLNFTPISGSDLSMLGSLKNLQSLSLAGTDVRAQDLTPVLGLPDLSSIFLWRTRVSPSQIDSLQAAYPTISFQLSDFSDDSVLRLSRPLTDMEGVIKRGQPFTLKHPMPGVDIRYTVDGSVPDTIGGALYDKPLYFDETAVVHARACKEGWYCSTTLEMTCFVEGIRPDSVKLLTQPDPKYPGEGASSLTDRRKGVPDVLKEPSWLGYRNQPFEAGVIFPSGTTLKKIVISYGKNIGAYCMPPEEVEVWGGSSQRDLKLLHRQKVEQPAGFEPLSVSALTISFEPTNYRYYKIVAQPVAKLPQWHNGKGQMGWVFVDELLFY